MIKKIVSILLALLLSGYSSISISKLTRTATNQDNTYKAVISRVEGARGFVRDIELRIKWTFLFGEPVTYYDFIWNRNNLLYFPDLDSNVNRDDLKKYPDLLKRYDSIRPSKLHLRFVAEIIPDHSLIKDFDGTYFDKSSSIGSKFVSIKMNDVNEQSVMITRSGKVGYGISPGTPESISKWLGYETSELSNKKWRKTFKYAKEIRFSGLRIDKRSIPWSEITAIGKEYLKREKKEESKEDLEDLFNEKGAGEQTTSKPSNSDDLESFLNEDVAENNAHSETDDLESMLSSARRDGKQYEIVMKSKGDGTYSAVKSANGKILIPFTKGEIKSYEDGVARVERETFIKRNGCYRHFRVEEGYVNKTGKYIEPPKTRNKKNRIYSDECSRLIIRVIRK